MSDLAGPGPQWSDEILAKECEIRRGEPMQVERVQIRSDGFTFYRIHSEYAKDSVAVGPRELMKLLTWLQENEQQLIQDALDNDVRAGMREIERDEQ